MAQELTEKQVKALVAWTKAGTTGYGLAFTAAFRVAEEVAAKDAAK